tara:strand:- start:70 stop:540 length:471 start_codon:yes stop_codon:yes gene_type:complete
MRNAIYINFIFTIFLIISCEKGIPETDIRCNQLKEENGLVFMNNKEFSGSCYSIFNFDGEYEFNGRTNEVRTYKKGLRHGVWAKYYKNGQLEYKGNCKKGYIHGEYTGYYENGQMKEVGKLKEGYRDGVWQIYNEQGALVKKEVHNNKKLITTEYY